MLLRTHLAITFFFVLLFITSVEDKFIFAAVALMSTCIPDVDIKSSKIGKYKIFRPLQWLEGHRGIIHSFTFLFLITLFFVLFIPSISLGFFLGYGTHLLADIFTVEGLKPFYPFNKKSSGKIKTGGKTETSIFAFFVIVDVLFSFLKIYSVF